MRNLLAVVMAAFLCGTADAQLSKKDKAKVDAATAQIGVLDQAVKAYHVKNNAYPENLNVLVTDMFVEPKAILDPWDKEFHYDATGKHNGGKKPDIWTRTPLKKTIGNWPAVTVDAKKLLGKWEGAVVFVKGSGKLLVEFADDGNMKMTIISGGERETNTGKYRLDGNELSMTVFAKKDEKMLVTITKLTESEFSWRNDEGPAQAQFQSFRRVKDEKK